jgi:aspartate aminotransferase-like enzyme
MATKSSSRHSTSADDTSSASASAMAPLNMMSEVARHQLSLMTDAVGAVLGSSEAASQLQQQAAQQACARHRAAAETLRGPCDPMDVLTIQSDLVRLNLQDAAQYWSQLASTALKSQVDMMSRMGEMLNSGSQGGLTTAIDAWRTAVNATPNGMGSRSDMH